ncbi:putative proton-dependent oligopeptide transporter family, major facilitator superfamily [Helianthus annuus]|uniref:Proton-dependent oligopeptide transporter family, major facilitator superfamily n=1 Tax=Helianthus annuus TaxID=4232 RepID=A0A251RNA2_HELAN|nr:protein NRT1/ PTR FAMILY 2.13 [Helianthus annuus]KAF5754809.1 putative proton-dependent oligopeptide transporter family, major facilitator superfamily [Helianthus annuus]
MSSSRSMPPPSLLEDEVGKAHHHSSPPQQKSIQRKPGGWKSMPYILGNESFERLASIGLVANFTVFLMTVFHMNQVSASNLINIWSGITNFTPLVGAFISDAYVGKFWVIAFSSFASLLGMVIMTLIVALPKLLPPSCAHQQALLNQCQGPTSRQFGLLVLALGFLSIGAGGIRPCSMPFGVDQFDPTTDEGRKGISSFFNWYYTTLTVIMLIAVTLVVYIQDSVSWVLGFSISTMLMACSIVLFFVGTKMYIYVKPEGSIFSGIAQTLIAAYKKRNLEVEKAILYDPPITKGTYQVPKLPLTNRFKYFNKAAIILDGETNLNGSQVSSWNLASIQQVEEVKCLIKVIPILVSGIFCFTTTIQQGTFTVSQALKMDRHLGPHFQIPAGSIGVISLITIGIWLPIYDRILVPSLRKRTKIESGITLLQRMGIGIGFSILAMIVAALVEKKRRDSATYHNRPDGLAPLSVMWLAPQLILIAFAEVFNSLGQLEFYYKEFPDNMKSVSNAMFCVMAGTANYVSSALVTAVHKVTGKHGRSDWLTADINVGRVDYFYYVIAGLGVLNMGYYLLVSSQYQFKEKIQSTEEESGLDIELNASKK